MRTAGVLAIVGALFVSGCLGSENPQASSGGHEGHGDHDDAADGGQEHDVHAGHGGSSSPLDAVGFDVANAPDLARTPPFPIEAGRRPTYAEARDFAVQYQSLRAVQSEGLDKLRNEGHLKGAGTATDPYLLENFYVAGDLSITSTDRALTIRNGYVEGTLRLNYIGEALYVHHVEAGDLRVNENVKRAGPNTGGLFHDNHFGQVGQIRHFVGEFRDNAVGPKPSNAVQTFLGDSGVGQIPADVVFNLDGFHRGLIHHNAFDGAVVMKLHGHNHGDCFTCVVHDHANATLDEERMGGHDHGWTGGDAARDLGFETHHSIRYSSLSFHSNTINVADGVALRYNDRNHAGDDRTANSEPNEDLNDPHVHFQDVTIRDNKLQGGGLVVDVWNAADDRHPVVNHGILRLIGNDIAARPPPQGSVDTRSRPYEAVRLVELDGIELVVQSNKVHFLPANEGSVVDGGLAPLRAEPQLTGFHIVGAKRGNITIAEDSVASGTYGVYAERLDRTLEWALQGNDFRTQFAWRGRDVGNPPQEG